jgi:arylsulfatase A-like enzyme
MLNISGDTFASKLGNAFGSLLETGSRGFLRQPAAIQYKAKEIPEFQEKAEEYAADPSLGFVFLHVPVPHQPHPFDRKTGEFDVKVSGYGRYFDSLALLGRMFGGLRHAMERQGVWENTVVLISSDHPFRSAELIGRRFDPRVPYLLRFPHDEEPARFRKPLQTIVTANLLLSILRDEVRNRADAVAWLERHHDEKEMPVAGERP